MVSIEKGPNIANAASSAAIRPRETDVVDIDSFYAIRRSIMVVADGRAVARCPYRELVSTPSVWLPEVFWSTMPMYMTTQQTGSIEEIPLRGRTVSMPRVIGLVVALLMTTASVRAEDLLVFAAASLKPALDELKDTPAVESIGNIRFSFAASSQLARQIEHGAPAALFISADQSWMDHLQNRALIAEDSRVDLLGNALVLIAPADNSVVLDLMSGLDIVSALGIDGRLAIAEPDSVPAGKYTKTALIALGAWPSIETRTVRAANVRAALNFVARREAPLGIVYRTDALSENAVRTVDTFPAATHAPIVYPAAIVRAQDSPAARRLLATLHDNAANNVFRRYGFIVLTGDQPDVRD